MNKEFKYIYNKLKQTLPKGYKVINFSYKGFKIYNNKFEHLIKFKFYNNSIFPYNWRFIKKNINYYIKEREKYFYGDLWKYQK